MNYDQLGFKLDFQDSFVEKLYGLELGWALLQLIETIMVFIVSISSVQFSVSRK